MARIVMERSGTEDGEPMATFALIDLTEEEERQAIEIARTMPQRFDVSDFDPEGGWFWALCRFGNIEIGNGMAKIHLPLYPEGDDRLDPDHPHWVKPRETIWMDAIEPARALFAPILLGKGKL